MKFYLCHRNAHIKNIESIRKMLDTYKIEYVESTSLDRINDTFDVAICFDTYFPPSAFPTKCKVLYGPHFFVFPEDANHAIRNTTHDASRFFYNTLCDWNKKVHESFCMLPYVPYVTCPFGVNVEDIKPVPNTERPHILVYYKRRQRDHLTYVQSYLESNNIPYRLVEYGNYRDDYFKYILKSTKFVIWIGTHESQGFALQETLAANVPVLLWDAKSMFQEIDNGRVLYEPYKGKYDLAASSAPAWSNECGIRFYEKEEFVDALKRMNESWKTFAPREFIEKTVGLKASMENMAKVMGFTLPQN